MILVLFRRDILHIFNQTWSNNFITTKFAIIFHRGFPAFSNIYSLKTIEADCQRCLHTARIAHLRRENKTTTRQERRCLAYVLSTCDYCFIEPLQFQVFKSGAFISSTQLSKCRRNEPILPNPSFPGNECAHFLIFSEIFWLEFKNGTSLFSMTREKQQASRKDAESAVLDIEASVTRLLDYFSTFGHFNQWKFAQKYTKFAEVGSKFCQIVNKCIKNCPSLLIFCQSGEILPILVTQVEAGLCSELDILGQKLFGLVTCTLLISPFINANATFTIVRWIVNIFLKI